MKKLLKLAMIGLTLGGGRRHMRGKFNHYGHHNAYGYGTNYPAMGYMPYKARKRMKHKMQKRMLKHALRQIF